MAAETFARAWLSRERFADQADGSARPWLLGIARNVLADSVRKERVERQALERLGVSLASEPDSAEIDERWLDGLDEDLAAALAELTDDQREAVLLRVVEEQSYDDVARKLGCTRETARVRVFRALERMRGRLGVTTGETTSNGGN